MALRDLVIHSGPKPPVDILAGLKDRLRATTYRYPNGRAVKQLRNPDGPEAATIIELLQAQVAPAQAIEAPGAETLGSACESAVAESDAPKTVARNPSRQGEDHHGRN